MLVFSVEAYSSISGRWKQSRNHKKMKVLDSCTVVKEPGITYMDDLQLKKYALSLKTR